jgi:hypothetical protein
LFDKDKSSEFKNNVIKWLTGGSKLNRFEIIELDRINFDTNNSLRKYKIIIWDAFYKMEGIDLEAKLIDYLENGGI